MTLQAYHDFLSSKRIMDVETGIHGDLDLPDYLFAHQRVITGWALRRGRAAVFAGTGLGKTRIELVWSDRVSKFTQRPVLLLSPLAVAPQHLKEAQACALQAKIVWSGGGLGDAQQLTGITNYQKLENFDLSAFGGIALDESSILKNESGHYRNRLIELAAAIPFRLAATATPAPNDYMELGNHAEFLGIMTYHAMLASFFTHDGSETQKWRLKGHAEQAFWRWMASWSVVLTKPSDLGFPDDGYDLPLLRQRLHRVETARSGFDLFPVEAKTLAERRAAARDSMPARITIAISLTPSDRPYVWWGNLNAETEAVTAGIPGAVEVRGSDKDDDKAAKLRDFSEGRIRVLVTKPSIAGFGMNWQHCANTGFIGLNDSFEQVYQAIRRFWRFGQQNEVDVDFIAADTEGAVIANLDRKERDAERMVAAMVKAMAGFSAEAVRGAATSQVDYTPGQGMRLPNWEEFAA